MVTPRARLGHTPWPLWLYLGDFRFESARDLFEPRRTGLRNGSHEATKPRRRRGGLAPHVLPFAYFLTTVRDIPRIGITELRDFGITSVSRQMPRHTPT